MPHPLTRSWSFSWAAAGRSPRTMAEMTRIRGQFEAVLTAENRDLTTATRTDCEAFLASLPTPTRKAWGWRSLRSFYAFAAEELEQPSPMARIRSPKVPLSDVKVASPEDVDRMLRACSPWRTATNARDAAIIATLWATGARRSEIAALRLDDVDLDTMSVLIRTSKSGKPRRAPLDHRAAQHIARWLARRATYPVAGGSALWVGKAGPLSSDGVRQVIERRRGEAGVDVSAHSFRRGWAAHALGTRGISQASVMVAAGWTTPTMPNTYVRSVREEVMLTEFHREGR